MLTANNFIEILFKKSRGEKNNVIKFASFAVAVDKNRSEVIKYNFYTSHLLNK